MRVTTAPAPTIYKTWSAHSNAPNTLFVSVKYVCMHGHPAPELWTPPGWTEGRAISVTAWLLICLPQCPTSFSLPRINRPHLTGVLSVCPIDYRTVLHPSTETVRAIMRKTEKGRRRIGMQEKLKFSSSSTILSLRQTLTHTQLAHGLAVLKGVLVV